MGYVLRFGANGLVGHHKFGFDYDRSRYPGLYQDGAGQPFVLSGNPARSRKDRDEYYVLVDQMLLRTGKADTDGVVVLGGYVHADRDISPLANQVFGGVLSSASVIGRPKDSFGAPLNHIRSSGRLTATQGLEAALGRPLASGNFGAIYGVQSHEEVVELRHTAHVCQDTKVEPDFQCVIRLRATSAVCDAAALGARTDVQL